MSSAGAQHQHHPTLVSSMCKNMLQNLHRSGLSRCKLMPPHLPKSVSLSCHSFQSLSPFLPQRPKSVSLSCRAQEAPGCQPQLSPSRPPSEAWQYVKNCAESVQPQDASRSHSPNTSCVSLFLSFSLSVQHSCCVSFLLLLLSPVDASSASVEPSLCTHVSHGSQVTASIPVRMAAACQISLSIAMPKPSREAVYTCWANMQHEFLSSFIWCLLRHVLAL